MHLTSDKKIWIPDDEDWINWGAGYEQEQFDEVIPHISNRDVALDVGAHVGIWSMRLAQHFKRVIAFEPVPKPLKVIDGIASITLGLVMSSILSVN